MKVVAPSQASQQSNVLICPAQSFVFVRIYTHFREAKISQDDVPIAAKEDILGLEVPVNNPIGVEMLKCKDHLSDVNSCLE